MVSPRPGVSRPPGSNRTPSPCCSCSRCGPMFMSIVSSPNSSRTSGFASRPAVRPLSAALSTRLSSLSISLPQILEGALCADLEALQQRMVVEVVLPHVQPPQVRVPLEGDTEHIVRLPLVPVGGRVDAGYRVYDRLLALDAGPDPDLPAAQIEQLVRQLERSLPIHDGD